MRSSRNSLVLCLFLTFIAVIFLPCQRVTAQNIPPDVSVCDEVTCQTLPSDLCTEGGLTLQFLENEYNPPNTNPQGSATYVYLICSPEEGQCDSGPKTGASCGDHEDCSPSCNTNSGKCQGTQSTCTSDADCAGTCNRDCAVDDFHGLSHLDVLFPELGGVESCLSAETTVSGTCTCDPTSQTCSVDGNVVTGDGSCFEGGGAPDPEDFVAKCANTQMGPGDCIKMSLTIAGELTGLGFGASVAVDKEALDCNTSCITGPACDEDRCDEAPEGAECLTRTIGFWGTHPWITNNYVPITVCGHSLGCSGADDGMSNPACLAFPAWSAD